MADRADYLARTLISRLATLQAGYTEDGRGEPDRRQRIEVIEKVLAVELGVTDAATMSVIEAAVPNLRVARAAGRETAVFAEFLRQRLARQLAES